MIYKIRVKNSMFGYESDRIHDIAAFTSAEAVKKGEEMDQFAEVTDVTGEVGQIPA